MLTPQQVKEARIKHENEAATTKTYYAQLVVESILKQLENNMKQNNFRVYVKETTSEIFVSPDDEGAIVVHIDKGEIVRSELTDQQWSIIPVVFSREDEQRGITNHYFITA